MARVSAAITTPPSKIHPTIVVPVLVALGSGVPWAWSAAFRLWFEKSKPTMMMDGMGWDGKEMLLWDCERKKRRGCFGDGSYLLPCN